MTADQKAVLDAAADATGPLNETDVAELESLYETAQKRAKEGQKVDKYGSMRPRYVAVPERISKTFEDEKTHVEAAMETPGVLYYTAICNPPKGFALYKVGENGNLTLLTANFD